MFEETHTETNTKWKHAVYQMWSTQGFLMCTLVWKMQVHTQVYC
jgi:hypothetical protein